MDVGLFTELQGSNSGDDPGAYRELLEQVDWAERLGYKRYWFAEIHFQRSFSLMSAPLLVAAAAAARTKRIRLGIGVNLLPFHHPLRLAEEAATVDLLSEGRLDFGVGRGHPHTLAYRAFQIAPEETRPRLRECLTVLLKAWTEDKVAFNGRFFQIDSVEVVPRPVQRPHPPIFFAFASPDTIPMAAEFGGRLLCAMQVIPLLVQQNIMALYQDHWNRERAGAPIPKPAVLLPVFVHKNGARARDLASESVLSYYRINQALISRLKESGHFPKSFEIYEGIPEQLALFTYEHILKHHAAIGDPAECIDKLRALEEALGAGDLIAWMNIGGGIPQSAVISSMQLFSEEVLPHL